MAARRTNLCVYKKGHCRRRNSGPYCTALGLCVMSSVKWAAGEDWGILSLSLSVCVVLNFTKWKDFYCRTKHPSDKARRAPRKRCIQVEPCLFALSVRRASALVSAVICLFLLVGLLLCLNRFGIWGVDRKCCGVCLWAEVGGRHSLWWICGVRAVCAG